MKPAPPPAPDAEKANREEPHAPEAKKETPASKEKASPPPPEKKEKERDISEWEEGVIEY
ncbi:MAG: hypothetical protein IRZ16_11015 [Myxococcaceae bacterium]|nr:hypothetical protein [Myxococcaceae bacterium]